MFQLVVLFLFALCKHNVDADDAVTASLLEEVMALKDQITTLQLEMLELQLSSDSCDDSSGTSGGPLNGTAYGQLQYTGGDTFAEVDSVQEWSGFRVYGISTAVVAGLSNAIVTVDSGSYTDLTVSFLATIDDLTEHYTIQFGINSNSFTFDNSPSSIDGITPPIMVSVIQYLGSD